jgi:hypothetical protein
MSLGAMLYVVWRDAICRWVRCYMSLGAMPVRRGYPFQIQIERLMDRRIGIWRQAFARDVQCTAGSMPLCLYTCLYASMAVSVQGLCTCLIRVCMYVITHTHTHTHTQIYYWALRAPYFSAEEKTSRLIYKDPRIQTVYDMGPNWMTWYGFFWFYFICLMSKSRASTASMTCHL